MLTANSKEQAVYPQDQEHIFEQCAGAIALFDTPTTLEAGGLQPKHFSDRGLGVLYHACCVSAKNHGDGRADPTEVLVWLEDERRSGIKPPVLARLMAGMPRPEDAIAAHADFYTKQIIDGWTRRQIQGTLEAALRITSREQDGDLWATLDKLDGLKAARTSEKAENFIELAKAEVDPEAVLLENRYLCRKAAMLFVGPSGIGKSSSSTQMDILWACGRASFGIVPAHPLRVLCVQAENDRGDLTEMAAGVLSALDLTDEEKDLVRKNALVLRHQTSTGEAFIDWLNHTLARYKPDILRLDPLMAFLGADPKDTAKLAAFCRAGLNPLADRYDCGIIVNHHTPKTTGRDTSEWRESDWMYAGAGGADLTNWARAALIVDPTSDSKVFRFIAAKRGWRIGWTDGSGNPSRERFFAHSREPGRICWEDASDDAIAGLGVSRRLKGKREAISGDQFLALLPAVNYDEPKTSFVTTKELEMRAVSQGWTKAGLAGLRDQLEREGKIAVLREPGRAHRVLVGLPQAKSLLDSLSQRDAA